MRYAERSWSSHVRLQADRCRHGTRLCYVLISFGQLTRLPTTTDTFVQLISEPMRAQKTRLALRRRNASLHTVPVAVLAWRSTPSRQPFHRPFQPFDLPHRIIFNTPASMMVPDSAMPARSSQSNHATDGQVVEVKTWDKHRNNPMAEVVLVSRDKIGFRVEAWYIQKHR